MRDSGGREGALRVGVGALRPWGQLVLGALVLAGAVSFVVGLTGPEPVKAWQALLVNFLFWSGLAQGGVAFAAIFQVAGAGWPRTMRRVAEAAGGFLPVSWIAFLILFLGRKEAFPWAAQFSIARPGWLAPSLFFLRTGGGLLALYVLSLLFLYFSVRPALGSAYLAERKKPRGLVGFWLRGWRGQETEAERCRHLVSRLAPAILVVYGVVFSFVAFDMIMALDPRWTSALIGGFVFVGNLYGALAFVALVSLALRCLPSGQGLISGSQLHDLAKLLFGFSLLWVYLFWSQYLVIWYGNLPPETAFLLSRFRVEPWKLLSVAVLLCNFAVPFVALLSRRGKTHRRVLLAAALAVAAGLWLEDYVLVTPSLSAGKAFFGVTAVLVTAGFGAAFLLLFSRLLALISLPPAAGNVGEAQAPSAACGQATG